MYLVINFFNKTVTFTRFLPTFAYLHSSVNKTEITSSHLKREHLYMIIQNIHVFYEIIFKFFDTIIEIVK